MNKWLNIEEGKVGKTALLKLELKLKEGAAIPQKSRLPNSIMKVWPLELIWNYAP